MTSDLITEFLRRYAREYDFYEQVGRRAAHQLEADLVAGGIRAIVTSRAKALSRLEVKARQRNDVAPYPSVDAIFEDIADLAGVRVALYFPGEQEEVDRIIKARFVLASAPKEFPVQGDGAEDSGGGAYKKRFSGYSAVHYRVHLRPGALTDDQQRYSDATVEIQVASVLMHAWAEVEHDLVYKPLRGNLDEDEYAILDELNGLVLSGEIALERLQRAVEYRLARAGTTFQNHYDLAAYLFERTRELLGAVPREAGMGRVDVLFELLKKLGLDSSAALEDFLSALHENLEMRPVAAQIMDQILEADSTRYKLLEEVWRERGERPSTPARAYQGDSLASYEDIGRFLRHWVAFEGAIRSIAEELLESSQGRRVTMPSAGLLRQLDVLDEESVRQMDRVRSVRNHLVHGIEPADRRLLSDATQSTRNALTTMHQSDSPLVKEAAERALQSLE